MNKKNLILVVVLIFIVSGLIIAIYLKKSSSSQVVEMKKGITQETQVKAEIVKEKSVELQKITNDLNSINDEDFGEGSLSDANVGL
jgi:hypothetical protein